MKKNILSSSLIIIMMIAAMSMTTTVFAQGRGNGQGMKKGNQMVQMMSKIPDLSKEQVQKIKSLQIEMMKQITPLKAELQELKAHLRTLSIAEKVDHEMIDKTIDKIGSLQTKMMKIHAKFRQEIRSVLSDEQRIVFDSMSGKMMGGHMGHHGSKKGNCQRGM